MATSLRLSLMVVWAVVIGTLLPANAPALDYPKHPITVIVPFAVGGLTDVPVRVLTAMLQIRSRTRKIYIFFLCRIVQSTISQ
jgi:tripartite-type tricarboxylate transporter receptor subunit TctC